jgi:hypothetical protein
MNKNSVLKLQGIRTKNLQIAKHQMPVLCVKNRVV